MAPRRFRTTTLPADGEEFSMPDRTDASGFKRLDLHSQTARDSAVYALSMICDMRWYKRLIRDGSIRDDDVLTLIGLQAPGMPDEDLTTALLEHICKAQHKHLTLRAKTGRTPLDKNIARLGKALCMSDAECKVLRLAATMMRTTEFSDLFELVSPSEQDLMRAIHHATGARLKDVAAALSPQGTLRRGGFFESESFQFGFRCNPLELDEHISNNLYSTSFDENQVLRQLLRPCPEPRLALEDFSHLRQATMIGQYIADAVAKKRKGVNVLIYGAPGTGKTEYARSLAASLDLELNEVPNDDRNGEPISGHKRFGAYTVCQNLLANRPSQLLVFDEVEDVFGSGRAGLFDMGGRDPGQLRKSWINETLESNPVPTIWICNSVRGLEAAYIRRFDIVSEFPLPSISVRRRIVTRYFGDKLISSGVAEKLASIETLSPAQIQRTASVVEAMGCPNLAERDEQTDFLIRASLRAAGQLEAISSPTLPDHYDTAYLNTDRDLDKLAAGLVRTGQGRVCLYGPPGTGKTAFAHHLGKLLDKPVQVNRGSDLLDMYVGGTEAKIAEAFHRARDEQAILVIDEADSFLRDRAGASQSWEVSHVNELLTQMEAFDGIFIASTNLMDTLDAASLRRFDFKIRFDYLTVSQRRALLATVADGKPKAAMKSAAQQLDQISCLTPGDFANVLRQLRVTGESADPIRVVDLLEAEAQLKPERRHRGIGFVQAH